MGKEKIIIIVNINSRNFKEDIEVPKNISANDLIIALNSAYNLKIDTSDVANNYLKVENPIVLLRGNKTLEEFGLHDGSEIIINTYEET